MCETVVYILGLYHCFGELSIYGVYTDRKKLYEKYQMLLREDDICLDYEYPGKPEKPHIYQLPLNTFIGEKMDWGDDTIWYPDTLDEREIAIEDLIGREL